jgi:glycerophosphoryl diester phosphodiesterase
LGDITVQDRRPATRFLACLVIFALCSTPLGAVEVVCHRGANEYAPENTLAAAQLCIEWGVAYVELDVRTSKDGVMYLLHDPLVNRTTNGKGFIHQLTSSEIDALDAGSWFDAKFTGEKVPRLEPYLRSIKGKIKVYFDVKSADLAKLIALVYDVGMEKDCFFWFDRAERALQFRELNRELALKVNVRNVDDVRKAAEHYKANIIETGLRNMTPELVAACREQNLRIMVIETKKDPDAFRQIIECGADLVNLDHGDVFLKVERELKEKAAAGDGRGGK